MNAWQWPARVTSDAILGDLSNRQFLQPHRTLQQTLRESSESLGFCPGAAQTALEWLQLDAKARIGRLTRTQLIQLARSIHRFWQKAVQHESESSIS